MAENSRILLDIENNDNPSPSSSIQSKLIVCQNKPIQRPVQRLKTEKSSLISSSAAAPKSQVLGKVKDFLGLMAESNKKLQMEAMNNPKEYDIEAITGDEAELIEFDLMLGVADLNTPEAVAAAESAISSNQKMIELNDDSTDSDSESENRNSSDDELGNCRSKKKPRIVEVSK